MTPAQATRIANLATRLAIEAPRHKSRFAVSATVSWETMLELREALTEAGVDLPLLFKQMKKIREEHTAWVQAQREGRGS